MGGQIKADWSKNQGEIDSKNVAKKAVFKLKNFFREKNARIIALS